MLPAMLWMLPIGIGIMIFAYWKHGLWVYSPDEFSAKVVRTFAWLLGIVGFIGCMVGVFYFVFGFEIYSHGMTTFDKQKIGSVTVYDDRGTNKFLVQGDNLLGVKWPWDPDPKHREYCWGKETVKYTLPVVSKDGVSMTANVKVDIAPGLNDIGYMTHWDPNDIIGFVEKWGWDWPEKVVHAYSDDRIINYAQTHDAYSLHTGGYYNLDDYKTWYGYYEMWIAVNYVADSASEEHSLQVKRYQEVNAKLPKVSIPKY